MTIFGVYRSRACRNAWLAVELGIPFDHVPVIQAGRLSDPEAPDAPINTCSPAFLAVNPFGKIPAVKDGELVLAESLAINLYLAKKVGGPLAPATIGEDGEMMMWTLGGGDQGENSATIRMRTSPVVAGRREGVARP